MVTIRSFALGGLDEVGKNLFVVEVDQDIFIFDCGLKFLKEVDFGINSLIPDFSYLIKNRHRIKGLFVTKIDIATAYGIPFLLKKIPKLKIFTSKVNCELLKQNESLSVHSWEHNLYQIGNQPLKLDNNFVHCFYTATNLPGSCGFSLETIDGYIVYTGSFILENNKIEEIFSTQIDKIIINKNKPVLLLITNANELKINDFVAPHHQIDKFLDKILFDFQKTLFICCEENEWYKIFQVVHKIKHFSPTSLGLKFFDKVFSKNFCNIIYQLTKDNYWKKLCQQTDSSFAKAERKILFLTGSQKWLFSRILSLINNKNYSPLTEDDHIWIISESSFIGELVVGKTLDELYKTNAKVTFTGKGKMFPMEAAFEDVKLLINLLKPKYLFPVNALHQDLENSKKFISKTHLDKKDIFIRENGEIITIKNQKYSSRYEAIILENIFVDNFLNTNINETVINERKILSGNGALFVSFCYSKNKNNYFLTSQIKNTHFGITKKNEQITKITNEINKGVLQIFKEKKQLLKNNCDLKQQLRKMIIPLVKKITNKIPLVFITANFL